MTSKLDQYQRLQSRADKLQREADRAEGALDQLLTRLSGTYEVTDLNEAKSKLKELQSKADEAEQAYRSALDKFVEDWGDVLEEYA